jgi:heterodisulfide reductase subunit A
MGPKPIQECITDAGAAASRVATFLKDETAVIDLITSYIDPEICMKCGKCAEECVYDAIDTTGDVYKVIDVACQSCGKCASICPTNAIDLRMFLDKQIEAHVDGILAEDKDSIIALVCTQCGYNASDIAGTARLQYPERVKIIKLPCTARVSVNAMLYPFLKGAKGVMVVGCYEGTCHYIDGNIGAKERANLAKQALDLMGVGGWRLEFFNMSSAEGQRFAWAASEMDKRIVAAQASGGGS